MTALLLILLAAYLMGSFPTSIVVARRARGIDIREHGSGNAGGTNVLRVVGWKAALLVALVDVGKGTVASLLPHLAPAPSLAVDVVDACALAGTAAVVGHVFPIFAGFRGGKGVGTSAGGFAVTQPLALACAAPVFFLTVLTTRWVSLGSILGALTLPLAIYFTRGSEWIGEHAPAFWSSIFLAVLIVVMHRANISRIVRGEESRLGDRASR
jgi:acyl phosphate:glycerol-3-phosphate acyltransferase